MSKQDLANFLRQRAEACGMTATAIADKADVARQTYHRLLNAETTAELQTLNNILNALDTPLEQGLEYYYMGSYTKHFKPNFLKKSSKHHPLQTKTLREFLNQCLEDNGLTVSALAAKSGLSRQTVSKVRNATTVKSLKLDTISQVARALNISVYDLIQPSDHGIYFKKTTPTPKPIRRSQAYNRDSYI